MFDEKTSWIMKQHNLTLKIIYFNSVEYFEN